MRKTYIIAVVASFTFLQSVYPQITTNEPPISIQRGLQVLTKDKAKKIIDLPVPDIKKVLLEDSLYNLTKPYNPERIGIPIPLLIDSSKDGEWTILEDGGKLWQMEVRANNALALDFVFSKFWLPKRGKFFIFNPVTNETIGAVTSQYLSGEKNKPSRFSTRIIKGDNMVLEYYQPAEETELPIIMTEKTYYLYKPIPKQNGRSNCFVNVNCSEGNNWQLEKNAVAIAFGHFKQALTCFSGSLVNNTQNDLTPYFLTADHCLEYVGDSIEKKDAINNPILSDWTFYWGYETDCSGMHVNDNVRSTTGAIVKANNSSSDFALLQLQQDPLYSNGYIPYYLGWDASGNSGTGGVCIHHPANDLEELGYKKISTYNCTPQTLTGYPLYWGVQWIQTDNGHSVTNGGSSGSPLINNNHHVIGQLHFGNTNCSNLTGTDKFGKFSVSWTGNGNSDYRRRLDYWLDPNGSNTNVIDGYSLYNMCSLSNLSGPSTICSSSTNTYTINNLPSGFTINWSVDNNNYFSISPSGYQCLVTYTGTQQYTVANLTANVKWNGTTIKTLTKRIVMHGTDLVVYGEQESYYSSNGLFPYRSFTIPANNGSRNIHERINREVFADKESLPINFIEDNTRDFIFDFCGYGITDINGGNRVYLYSTRFDGMEINFFGLTSPTYFYQNGSYVSFEMPYDSPNYPVTLQAHSDSLCHDFCLTFNVIPLPGVLSGDDIIWVNIDGSMLYVTFMYGGEPIGNGQFYFPSYSVTISKIPGGTCVYSNTFSGTQTSFSVNTSTWTSGIYSIRIVCNGNIYSKSICL